MESMTLEPRVGSEREHQTVSLEPLHVGAWGAAVIAAVAAASLPAASSALYLLVASSLVAAIVLIAVQKQPRVSNPLTVVAIVIVLAYGVRPVALAGDDGLKSYATLLDRSELSYPALLGSGFLIALAIGVLLATPLAARGPGAASGGPVERVRSPRLLASACAVLAVGLLALSAYVAGAGIASAYANPVTFRAAINRGGLFYLAGPTIVLAWMPLWLVVLSSVQRPRNFGLLLSTVVFGLALSYPFGQRSYILAPILGLIAWREYSRGPYKARSIILVGLAVAIAIGGYSTFRANVSATSAAEQYGVVSSIRDFSARFDTFDFFAQTANTFDGPYLRGRTVSDLLQQPLPRAIVPTKPSQTSAYLIQIQDPLQGRNFTPEYGIVTELLINGGPALVIAGGFAVGALLAFTPRFFRLDGIGAKRRMILIPFLMYPAFWILGGLNSFTTVSFLLMGSVQALIALLAVRRG